MKVAEVFVNEIVLLHCFPVTIVSGSPEGIIFS